MRAGGVVCDGAWVVRKPLGGVRASSGGVVRKVWRRAGGA